LFKFPIDVGIAPVREFESRYIFLSFGKFPISEENDPESFLLDQLISRTALAVLQLTPSMVQQSVFTFFTSPPMLFQALMTLVQSAVWALT
jgi:hypothetical protein